LLHLRYVITSGFSHIGKESHDRDDSIAFWEDASGEIFFGSSNLNDAAKREAILKALEAEVCSSNTIVQKAKVSKSTMRDLKRGIHVPSASLEKIHEVFM
jgi:hypothetical protein